MTPAAREIIRLPFRTERALQSGVFKRLKKLQDVSSRYPIAFARLRGLSRREGDRQLMSAPVVRQFVPAQRVLSLTSPRPEPPHGKARAGMLYPNRYFLLRDIYRTVLKRVGTGAIRATNIFPGDPRKSRRALAVLIRQLVATGEGILGLVRPKAKTSHREESVGSHSPNIDLFLLDGYRAAPKRKAA